MSATKVKFKEEVEVGLHGLDPGKVRILLEAADTAPEMVGGVIVVTSANDGAHKTGSLHYEDNAFDVRFLGRREGAIVILGPGLTDAQVFEQQRIAAVRWGQRLRDRLGDAYDVVVEKDHLHVEEDRR